MDYSVKQIAPNHATHLSHFKESALQEMFDNEYVICQPKYDGERMLLHFDGSSIYCTSRRYSKKTDRYMENQDKLPYLLQTYLQSISQKQQLGYTVLDCECYAKNWSEAVSVLHSLPERAKQLQDEGIQIKYAVFDCLFFDGKDIRNLPYIARLKYMYQTLDYINCGPKSVAFMQPSFELGILPTAYRLKDLQDADLLMNAAINRGYEGIVIKSLNRSYYADMASIKCKKFETVDTVVIDYQQGEGKYANTVGALIVGYYDSEKNDFVRVSKVNCGTDADRDWWRDNWETAKYSVLEVKCQEITESSLRHPVYIRRRTDKDYTMCTKETIFKC